MLPSLEKDSSLDEYLQKKILSPEDLSQKIEEIRSSKKTIATLNGSFDLLHAGHLHMIYEAHTQADILIIALNSDTSIQAYKSLKRPIIPLESRLRMVASLGFVDYVTFFDETTPVEILKKIKPDVHVNGSEYGENCIEAGVVKKAGGRIHIVSLIPGLSTSKIIEAIKTKCV